MSSKPSGFIWYELLTSDIDAAAAFYGSVYGWTVAPSGQPGMDYRIFSFDGVAIGGLMAISPEMAASGMRPVWLGYVSVADVDAKLAEITAAGGSALMPASDIPGVGRIALVADPQGAGLYIMAPIGTMPSQSYAAGKPGHGGWHELHTKDWAAASAYYAEHFGWAKSRAMDMGPMGTYQLFSGGGEDIGGMMTNTNVPHPFWLYYMNVADVTTAEQRLTAGGGKVARGPMEVPGGMWALQAFDPQGAMFAFVGPRAS